MSTIDPAVVVIRVKKFPTDIDSHVVQNNDIKTVYLPSGLLFHVQADNPNVDNGQNAGYTRPPPVEKPAAGIAGKTTVVGVNAVFQLLDRLTTLLIGAVD